MKIYIRLLVRLVIVSLLQLPCGGCITSSLITLGTVVGALGTAASTGADVYKLGKLDATLMVPGGDCHRAAERAADDLGLVIACQSFNASGNQVWDMTLRDKLRSPVGIHIEARTQRMCRCRVDVGIFGDEPTAKLVMERIRANLGKS